MLEMLLVVLYVLGCRDGLWIWRKRRVNLDGSTRYKARLVIKGYELTERRDRLRGNGLPKSYD